MNQTAIYAYFVIYGSLLGVVFLFLAAVWFKWWRKKENVSYGTHDSDMIRLVSLLGFFYFFAVLGSEFDGWWHSAVGRDDFWIMPHLVIILNVTCLTGATLFLLTRKGLQNGLSIFFLKSALLFEGGLYLGIALDNTAHNLFGQENISTPLVSLAPPHIFIGLCFLSIGFSLVGLLQAACQKEPERSFMRALIGGSMISFVIYQYQPFWPLGIYRVFGAFGQFIMLAIVGVVFSLLWRKDKRFLFAGFALSMVVVVLEAIRMSGGGVDPSVPYPFVPIRIPSLVLYVSFLMSGIAIDLLRAWKRHIVAKHAIIAGCVYGFTQSFFYYLPAKWWIDHKHISTILFSWPDIYFIIVFGSLGGALGFFIPWWAKSFFSCFNRMPSRKDSCISGRRG